MKVHTFEMSPAPGLLSIPSRRLTLTKAEKRTLLQAAKIVEQMREIHEEEHEDVDCWCHLGETLATVDAGLGELLDMEESSEPKGWHLPVF